MDGHSPVRQSDGVHTMTHDLPHTPVSSDGNWGGAPVRPLSVAFLSSAREAWGAEESLLLLASKLPANGVHPELWTPNPQLAERWTDTVGTAVTHLAPRAAIHQSASAKILKRMLQNPVDAAVIFNLDLAGLPTIMTLIPKTIPRPAFILDLHDYLPTRAGRAKLYLASHAFDSVIAVSRFSSLQVAARKVPHVLTRPVEPGPAVVQHTDQGITVGIVGRLDRDKGLGIALEALEHLPADYSLCLRGEATRSNRGYAQDLRTQAATRWGGRVRFEGRVEREVAMNGIRILLVTNPKEAMGRTVLEAQVSGVPVVVPDCGGAGELVTDGRNGFRYRSGDPKSLAVAIKRATELQSAELAQIREATLRTADPTKYARDYADIVWRSCRNRSLR